MKQTSEVFRPREGTQSKMGFRKACRGAVLSALLLLMANPAFAVLELLEMHLDGVNGMVGLEGARAVAVSPDGAHVYVASEFAGTVTAFGRDPATGSLTLVQTVATGDDGAAGLYGSSGVALSPDGAHVYVVGATDDAVAVFSRDPVTGELTFVQVLRNGEEGVQGIVDPRMVVVSPDGRHVYVPGGGSHAVAVFQRDPASGMLTFAGMVKNGVDGIDGLMIAHGIGLSPDGAHLCVAAMGDLALTIFERDPDTGLLSLVQVLRDGVDGVDGLMFASNCAFSADGSHVYATGGDFGVIGDRAVSVYDRDPASGELSFKQVVRQEAIAAGSVALSPDGGRAYVPGPRGNGIGVYARNATTGELRLLKYVVDGENGVDGLAGIFEVALSPDGAHLYGAARTDHAVTVFRVTEHVCCGDGNGDGRVTIEELVTAVNNAMNGCIE